MLHVVKSALMKTREIVWEIDNEIERLKLVRALLIGEAGGIPSANRSGKPSKKRNLSAAGRANMAAAQKKRWAKRWAKQKAAKKN